MRKTEDKHLFAVFMGNLFAQKKPRKDAVITITDQDLVRRIVTVLRMLIGEELQLFDDHDYYLAKITDIKKNKAITLQIISVAPNPKPKLEINFLLPLLKKEALEETIYSLTEIGVSSIQLLITDKSQKNLSDKEVARLKKIQIAAAEQSKYFSMPKIAAPIILEKFCTEDNLNGMPALLFDPAGKSVLELLTEIRQKKIFKVFCAIGPEGGLTPNETQLLVRYGFKMCKLTSTTLRALQAAAVGAGLLASIL
ncbi:MAG: ribosomal RNA small subunit methyltransferase E [Candidatus Babeliales bacterium]